MELKDNMGQIIGRKGKGLQEMKRMAKNRRKFRRWLHTLYKDKKGQEKRNKMKN